MCQYNKLDFFSEAMICKVLYPYSYSVLSSQLTASYHIHHSAASGTFESILPWQLPSFARYTGDQQPLNFDKADVWNYGSLMFFPLQNNSDQHNLA